MAKCTANKYASKYASAQIHPYQAFSDSRSTHTHDKETGWERHSRVESRSQNRMEAKILCLENYSYLHFTFSRRQISVLKISVGNAQPHLGDLKEDKSVPTSTRDAAVPHPHALFRTVKVKMAYHQAFRLLFNAHF